MTGTRLVFVCAPSADEAKSMVRDERWGPESTVVWVGEPVPQHALGLPPDLTLYEVKVVFRWSL